MRNDRKFFEDLIEKRLRERLLEETSNVTKSRLYREARNFRSLVIYVVIFVFAGAFFAISPTYTGFFALSEQAVQIANYTDSLNLDISQSQEYRWTLGNFCSFENCTLKSVSVTGLVIANSSGSSSIQIENSGKRYTIFSKNFELGNITTTRNIAVEQNISITNETTNETTTQTVNATQEINVTLQEAQTFYFSNFCVETCDLTEIFNQNSYNLIFSLSANITMKVFSVNYIWQYNQTTLVQPAPAPNISVANESVSLPDQTNQTVGVKEKVGGKITLKKFGAKDSKGKAVKSKIKLLNSTSGEVVNEISSELDVSLDGGKYDVELLPENHPVKKIGFKEVLLEKNLSELVKLDDAKENIPSPVGNWSEVYAIDASTINFTNATMTVTAKGNVLYKCKEWNFSLQDCGGSWTKLMNIVPGQNYTLDLTPEDPGFGEANITIIDVQSFPMVGGNWTVRFNTTGTADLIIKAINGTTWSNSNESHDLKLLEVRCDDSVLNHTWENDSVFIQNFSCTGTGYEVSKVLTTGVHSLEFSFGGDVKYAHNQAFGEGQVGMKTVEFFVNQSGGYNYTTLQRGSGVVSGGPTNMWNSSFYIQLPENKINVKSAWFEVYGVNKLGQANNIRFFINDTILPTFVMPAGLEWYNFRIVVNGTNRTTAPTGGLYGITDNSLRGFNFTVHPATAGTETAAVSVKAVITYEYDLSSPTQIQTAQYFYNVSDKQANANQWNNATRALALSGEGISVKNAWYEVGGWAGGVGALSLSVAQNNSFAQFGRRINISSNTLEGEGFLLNINATNGTSPLYDLKNSTFIDKMGVKCESVICRGLYTKAYITYTSTKVNQTTFEFFANSTQGNPLTANTFQNYTFPIKLNGKDPIVQDAFFEIDGGLIGTANTMEVWLNGTRLGLYNLDFGGAESSGFRIIVNGTNRTTLPKGGLYAISTTNHSYWNLGVRCAGAACHFLNAKAIITYNYTGEANTTTVRFFVNSSNQQIASNAHYNSTFAVNLSGQNPLLVLSSWYEVGGQMAGTADMRMQARSGNWPGNMTFDHQLIDSSGTDQPLYAFRMQLNASNTTHPMGLPTTNVGTPYGITSNNTVHVFDIRLRPSGSAANALYSILYVTYAYNTTQAQPGAPQPPANAAPNFTSNVTYQHNTTHPAITSSTNSYSYDLFKNISVEINITDPDGDGQIHTVNLTINGTAINNWYSADTPYGAGMKVYNRSGTRFYVNFTSMAVGTYTAVWWMNDTSNTQNQTGNFTITVSRATPSQTFTPTTATITYNATTNEACNSNSTDTTENNNYYRSGMLKTPFGDNFVNGVGSPTYSCDTLQTQNYSQVNANSTLTVNVGSTNTGAFVRSLGVANNNATVFKYPTTVTLSGNTTTTHPSDSTLTFNLYYNDTATSFDTGQSGTNATFHFLPTNATWIVTYNTSGNANRSASEGVMYFVILAATPVCIQETTQCYTTIQGAINAAGAYQTVVISNGNEYNESIVVNVTGLNITTNASTAPLIFYDQRRTTVNVSASNVTISRLRVLYNRTGTDPQGIFAAVYINNQTNITILNNTLETKSNSSDVIRGYLNSSNITDNVIKTNGTYSSNIGINITLGYNNTVSFNMISTNGTVKNYGIYVISGTNNTISSNNISTNGRISVSIDAENFGIYLDSGASNTLISRNLISTFGHTGVSTGKNYGIRLLSTKNSVTQNTIYTNGTTGGNVGISLFGNENNITSNTIYTNGTSANSGIESVSSFNNISWNYISASGSTDNNYGIYLSSGPDTVANNIILTNGTSSNYGILVQSNSNVLANNTIFTRGTAGDNYGIYLVGLYNTVRNATISTNGTSFNIGVNIFNGADFNSLYVLNISTDGTSGDNYGIQIDSSKYNNISHANISTFRSSTDFGVVFADLFQDINIPTTNNSLIDSIINATSASDVRDQIATAGASTDFFRNYIVNSTFNKTEINFSASSPGNVLVQYRLDLRVLNESSEAVSSATVTINDTNSRDNLENPTASISDTTNSTGYIGQKVLTEFLANFTYNSSTGGSGYLYFTNYTVNASKTGFDTNSTQVNLTDSRSITRVLTTDTTPPLITVQSPTNTSTVFTDIWANATVNEDASSCTRSLDGGTNVSLTNSSGNWNNLMTDVAGGPHNVIFVCTDLSSNSNSSQVFFTVTPSATISLDINSINFGSILSGTNDTLDLNPFPFVVQNDGNVDVNITIEGTSLWSAISNPNPFFQFNVSLNESNALPSFSSTYVNVNESFPTKFVNVPQSVYWLSNRTRWQNSTDAMNLHINITVPADETGAAKSSTITIIATQA